MKSLWQDEAVLYMSTQKLKTSKYQIDEAGGEVIERKKDAWQKALWTWHPVNEHWNYQSNEQVVIEIISNCPEIELFMNGKSQGMRKLKGFEDRIYKWVVPFEPGKILAKGKLNGQEIISEIQTSNKLQTLKITTDQSSLKADGYDVAHIVVQLMDQNQNPITSQNELIEFEVEGDLKVLGVDNGDIQNFQDFQSNKIYTYKGRCLLIVQSTRKEGTTSITASSKSTKAQTIYIKTKK